MSSIALLLCLLTSTALIVRDCRMRKSVSAAVWIPTILLLILGSRPVSLWVSGAQAEVYEMGNEASGSPLDMMFFALTLGSAFLVASLRGFQWKRLFTPNRIILVLYVYFAISILWSGDPIGSFKRIGKDFGLFFVIGVIASEKNPLEAMRAVYVRAAYVLIPLSVVFIKYFPSYARSYTIAGGVMVTGVTTQKNSLGEVVMILTLFLVWDYLEAIKGTDKRHRRIPWDKVLLLVAGAWLMHLSQSKTALLCTLVGAFLVARRGWFLSRTVSRIALAGALSLPFLVFFSQQFSSVIAPLIEALGRNMTFTGRTDIWNHVGLNTVNPLLGAGFWNFWGGPGGFAISQEMRTTIPNAHCGYVDMYLDGGLLGLTILFVVLITCGNRIIRKLSARSEHNLYLRMRLAFLVVAIIYNLSETTYFRIGPTWFTALLMMSEIPLAKSFARARVPVRKADNTALTPQPAATPALVSRGRL